MGVLERGDRDKNNETGLKEGGGIEMSTTVLPYTRCTTYRQMSLDSIDDDVFLYQNAWLDHTNDVNDVFFWNAA